MRASVSVVVALSVLTASPAAASILVPPVDAVMARRFEAPSTTWGPGHRGVDYEVATGTLIRAAAAGTVVFADRVPDGLAVTIAHTGGLETTYSGLSELSVASGDSLIEGTWVGRAGSAHGEPGLHFGVKVHDGYVDPASYFADVAVGDAIRLAPLVWQPPSQMPEAFTSGFVDPGTSSRLCAESTPLDDTPSLAPNDNVAVAVAGIGSSTSDGIRADMYEHGPEELGYPEERIERFSYAGSTRARSHVPYEARDTFGDIGDAARRLGVQLARVRRQHPGRDVDLIAHSMGGLVARRFLSTVAWQQPARYPRVEHLITFASPHQGSSLATVGDNLNDKTITGGLLVDGVSAWSEMGGPIPDPRSVAVSQMKPGSLFLEELARQSIVQGTRALTLAIPNDVVVTADRAGWEEARSRVVGPEGLSGHSAIVASAAAQGLAYDFLRDAAPSCETGWDLWGPRVGRVVGFAEEQSYRGLAAVEQAYLGKWLKLGKLGYSVGKRAGSFAGKIAEKVGGKAAHRAAVEGL